MPQKERKGRIKFPWVYGRERGGRGALGGSGEGNGNGEDHLAASTRCCMEAKPLLGIDQNIMALNSRREHFICIVTTH